MLFLLLARARTLTMSFLTAQPACATVVAEVETEVWQIAAADITATFDAGGAPAAEQAQPHYIVLYMCVGSGSGGCDRHLRCGAHASRGASTATITFLVMCGSGR